jgi:TonB-dependent starch-binding outer membrane protein SusC
MYKLSVVILIVLGSCTKNVQKNTPREQSELLVIEDPYGKKSARDFTGSAGVAKNPGNHVGLDLYLGSISGILVTGTGPTAQISIRGFNTLGGGIDSNVAQANEPLFIIGGTSFNGSFRDLYTSLNVNDIKNITVLKDASSTSIYGTRGANGVVIINLKKKEDHK